MARQKVDEPLFFAASPHGEWVRASCAIWFGSAVSAATCGATNSRVPGYWPMRHMSRLIRSGGLDWHVQVGGQGPTVLLLHGTGASAHSWSQVVSAFRQQVTVIVPDLPGHGFTEGAAMRDLSLPLIARALDQLLLDLDVAPIDLVAGHSSGAALALRWALGQTRAPKWVIGFNPALVAPPCGISPVCSAPAGAARNVASHGVAVFDTRCLDGNGAASSHVDQFETV